MAFPLRKIPLEHFWQELVYSGFDQAALLGFVPPSYLPIKLLAIASNMPLRKLMDSGAE